MGIQIKTWRNPYDAGFDTIKPRNIKINSGLTVLVGCNGAGKTTLIKNIEDKLKEQNIPYHEYDNLQDGGYSTVSSLLAGYSEYGCDDIGLGALLFSSSEGESIKINVGRDSTLYKEFIETGYFKDKLHAWSKIFKDTTEEQIADNRRVLLFDATDSGMSIDAVCELKSFLKSFITYAEEQRIELYIIISANEYELARNESCFDVIEGKYITFKDYDEYRNFIISSRQKKDKRIEQQKIWIEKQKQKEIAQYNKRKAITDKRISKIKDKALLNNRELSSNEKYTVSALERDLECFIKNCRFIENSDIER